MASPRPASLHLAPPCHIGESRPGFRCRCAGDGPLHHHRCPPCRSFSISATGRDPGNLPRPAKPPQSLTPTARSFKSTEQKCIPLSLALRTDNPHRQRVVGFVAAARLLARHGKITLGPFALDRMRRSSEKSVQREQPSRNVLRGRWMGGSHRCPHGPATAEVQVVFGNPSQKGKWPLLPCRSWNHGPCPTEEARPRFSAPRSILAGPTAVANIPRTAGLPAGPLFHARASHYLLHQRAFFEDGIPSSLYRARAFLSLLRLWQGN